MQGGLPPRRALKSQRQSFMTRPFAFNAVLSLIVLLVVSQPADAQLREGASDDEGPALVAARSFKCSFPWYTLADWTDHEPPLKSGTQELGFHIDGIDYRQATARLVGKVGSGDLEASPGIDSVSFIEGVPSGTPNITTVYAWRDSAGRFKAVHSRHTATGGGPVPSQQYGYCEVSR
jgi:hypothetical protein